MDITARQIDFINELTQRTRDRTLHWQQAAVRDTFQVAFPNHAIRLSGPASQIHGDYSLRIYDGEGNLTMEIGGRTQNYATTVEHLPFYPVRQQLIELYNVASAQFPPAQDANKIIEDVLGEIRQFSSKEAKTA